MYDFRDVHRATMDMQVRAWSVEQAIDHLRGFDVPHQSVVTLSKMIEDYVNNGDVSGVIGYAVEEGYNEGRFEAKQAIETDLELNVDEVFLSRGWIKTGPQEGRS